MLRRLSVRNYLLIEHLELDLGPGLTVLTGETGSGKSIVIGALGLAMGDRAEGNLLRDQDKRCVIELEVETEIGATFVEEWCRRNNVPQEMPMILRRQLEPSGRSRAFVNDTPVRLEQLRELGEGMVHVHSQHHTLLLNTPAFQLGLLDHSIVQGPAVKAYAECFQAWRQVKNDLAVAREQEAQARSERDYLQFQFEELDAARLVAGEQPELERALARADHAEELVLALRGMEEGIEGDRGVAAQLATIKQSAAKAARVDMAVQGLLDRLQSASIELKDIAQEAAQLAEQITIDPKEADRLRERSDLLSRLQHKHRVEEADALIALRDGLAERITGIGSLAEQVMELERNGEALHAEILEQAGAISAKRTAAIKPLADQVTALLKELGMPHATFRFKQDRTESGPTGIDSIRALFSANRDRTPEPLDKVASGGELGRVMLALISLAAASKELPTVIFDEIDTGVSGETAHRVGALLARMGQQRQVLAISHLPQIASKADTHLLVTKDHEAEHVQSDIRPLDDKERVEALARMLSGRKTTKAAMENAKELLRNK
ncbi:MAG: DNA repair protein RecN [Flavobacteriales bacterium]|jgi:DNA repair protein RecN (Recombination protein N)|nr:DNA repair protein RecN [Flavobacteriales bacterium]MCB0758580.1 DNA repair protein RecN [Flavobacteriales bacterium]